MFVKDLFVEEIEIHVWQSIFQNMQKLDKLLNIKAELGRWSDKFEGVFLVKEEARFVELIWESITLLF